MIQRQPPGTFESPSVQARATGIPAYEVKYLLEEDAAREVQAWLGEKALLLPDPHATMPGAPGSYQTTTLYLDTPEGDVFRRGEGYRTQKFRVRRYGGSSVLYIERKRKVQDQVSKRRGSIAETELPLLGSSSTAPEWEGHWFQRMAKTRRLGPAACMTYVRTALVGVTPEGAVRATFDREIRGVRADAWALQPVLDAPELFPGRVVVELKFIGAMPGVFKRCVEALRLAPARVSKYRAWRGVLEGESPGGEAPCRSS